MYYPVTDYIALALIISFLYLTLFICLLCLKHERIKKETIRQKNAHILDHGWNATEFSWFRYGQYNETAMTFTDKGNGHKVTVDADETFENGVLWQQDAESFVCMEPWNGWANSVNEDGKHEVLEPDEAMTSEWSITIEKA